MPVVSAALGRTATVALMMGAMLKGEEKLTIQVKGDGPAGQIVVDANANGEVRGYVGQPIVDLPLKPNGKLDVSAAVGEGFIYVIKDLGLKELPGEHPYRFRGNSGGFYLLFRQVGTDPFRGRPRRIG